MRCDINDMLAFYKKKEEKERMAQKMDSGIVAPLDNRIFLFNYFEKPKSSDEDFVVFWENAAKYIRKQDHFISTHLHRVIGPARFTWVNFAVFDSDDICCFGKPDPIWKEKTSSRSDSTVKPLPGQYSEIASYNGEPLTDGVKGRSEKARFLITAVTAGDSITASDLEGNWKSWMKTDFIHQKLKENLGWKDNLKDSLMYRMVKSRNPLVRYTVRTEITEMSDEDGISLAESVNKQKNVEGVETFTGFYKIHTNLLYEKE